jgi:hypothetical protein
LDGYGELTEMILAGALQDAHPRVRQHAVGLAPRLCNKLPRLRDKVLALSNDGDVRVRFQLALALGEIASRCGGPAWRPSRGVT